jgi:hypothetical protein
MMDQSVIKELRQETQSDFHRQVLKDCRNLVDMSRKSMSTYYDRWDKNQEVFKGVRMLDKEDQAAIERKEPEKMVVPMAYAQAMTFVSFSYALYTQRERFFELVGVSAEDHKAARLGEAFLSRDLEFNKFNTQLFQFLLDVARFSMGVFKVCWVRKLQRIKEEVQAPVQEFQGVQLPGVTAVQEVEKTKFLGNEILVVSPYRFFPDTRLPLSRFQEGEFVASETEYTFVALKQLEKEGVVVGVDHVKPMGRDDLKRRQGSRFSQNVETAPDVLAVRGSGQSKGTVLVTEVQRVIIPKDYMVDGRPLGPEDYPVKYLVWYANDSRVIRVEPLSYLHDEFTYTVAQFTPDQHELLNLSLMDTIDSLQSVITWFINSRITSVRKVISNYLIVDPEGVEMQDLKNRNPVIRLKPIASSRGGVDKYIKQLAVSDVTANHLGDVKFLQDIVQLVTGISENLMGQFHQGRRSATEARNVNVGAAARLKMIASLVHEGALKPLAVQMLSNLRDGLDEETVVRVVGLDRAAESGAEFVKASKGDLVGSYDFEVFDGTLPSEKGVTAQALQEVLGALMSNPSAAIALQIDPRAMLLEMLELRGVRNPERFTLLSPPPQQVAQPGEVANGQPNGDQGIAGLFGNGAGQRLQGVGEQPVL